MRKLSVIEEGFMTRSLNRNKSGEMRLEKKLPQNNINQFKEVDLGLPVVFSDKDLVIGGKDKFTWNEIENYKEGILCLGWRLPGWDELKDYFLEEKDTDYELRDDFIVKKENDEYKGGILYIYKSNPDTDKLEIYIDSLGQPYWADWSDIFDKKLDIDSLNKRNTARSFVFYDIDIVYEKDTISLMDEHKDNKIKVRLVKDKK